MLELLGCRRQILQTKAALMSYARQAQVLFIHWDGEDAWAQLQGSRLSIDDNTDNYGTAALAVEQSSRWVRNLNSTNNREQKAHAQLIELGQVVRRVHADIRALEQREKDILESIGFVEEAIRELETEIQFRS